MCNIVWVFTTTSFLSAVTDRNNPNRLLIRARCRKDLDDFRKKYCKRMGPTIGRKELGHGSDYPFRAWCGKKAFANAMRKVIMDMMYPNFKNEVTKQQGWERHNVYMDVWSTMSSAGRQGKLDGTYKAPPIDKRHWWDHDNGQRPLFGGWQPGPDEYDEETEETAQTGEELQAMGYTQEQIEDPFFCSDEGGSTRQEDSMLVSDLIGKPVRREPGDDTEETGADGPEDVLEFESLEQLTQFFATVNDEDESEDEDASEDRPPNQ